jgi:chaperonin GroES
MKPIGKYILIKKIEEEVETSSGILLSSEEANQMRYKKATVVEPGSDVTVIKKGDVIHFDKVSGYTMIIESDTYTVITERDVVVVL